MLTPRLTNCVECADIPSLLDSIDCKVFQIAGKLYNNTIFALNSPIDGIVMFDLLSYRRILTYKYCNPDYAGSYTVNEIASKVRRYTAGCVKTCYDVPDCTTSTTSTSTSTTSTTSTSSTTSTTTTSPGTTTTTTTTSAPGTTTTTTSTSSTTTTTTTNNLDTTTTTTTSSTTTTTTTNQIVEDYGYLYNWYAATDARNIANTGWHVPTLSDYSTLATYLSTSVGGKLKLTGTTRWNSPNTGATNEVGFNGVGNGQRGLTMNGLLEDGTLSVTDTSGSYTYTKLLRYNTDSFLTTSSVEKYIGGGIRLVKDSTDKTHGQTGTYTGNDGTIYNTICIDTQEWMSQNLKETQYRNGAPIPDVVDDSTWIALTSGARCAYIVP